MRAFRPRVRAERAFLAALGGGCDAPVGAHASCLDEGGALELAAFIAGDDGHVVVRGRLSGTEPESLGAALAARLLDTSGGASLLSAGVRR